MDWTGSPAGAAERGLCVNCCKGTVIHTQPCAAISSIGMLALDQILRFKQQESNPMEGAGQVAKPGDVRLIFGGR